MAKITVILGKATHMLIPLEQTDGIIRFKFPEIAYSLNSGQAYLRHADFIKDTLDSIEAYLKMKFEVELWTNHESLLGLLANRIALNKMSCTHEDVLFKLYDDDNHSHREYVLNSDGHLTGKAPGQHWPCGWFQSGE